MDEDYRSDEEMANRATTSRDKIVDISYPKELRQNLYMHFDSIINTISYKEFAAHDTTPLLTSDEISIKIFLNEKLNIRQNLDVRANDELKKLIGHGRKLISLLKNN